MDTMTVDEIALAVESELVRLGFSELTVREYRWCFRDVGRFSVDDTYTPGVGAAFAAYRSEAWSPPTAREKMNRRKRIARIFDAYLATGVVDLSRAKGENPPPMPESQALLEALGGYAAHNAERGLAESTCAYYGRLAREFALFAESRGFEAFDAMPAGSALEFVGAMRSGRWAGTSAHHFASNFRPFLRFLGRTDMVQALTLARQPRERHILPVIGDSDEEAIAQACTDGTVGLRDAAITLLALTTGMRSCDIIGLEMGGIDWRTSTATFVQRKTGNPVTVPLAPAVAEAIARYVLEGRPDSPHTNVFLSSRAPFGPIKGHTGIYGATRRAFAAAGVEGGGTLLMRHNAASKMVREGAELPVMAAVLGHADPDSSGAYMESDARRMRMCVIPPAPGAMGRARPFPLGDRAESDEARLLLCALPLPKAVVG